MKLTDILGAAGIITLIVLAFVLGKTCNEPPVDQSMKRIVDSLILEQQKTAAEMKSFRESMDAQLRRKDSTIVSLAMQMDAARTNARKSSENASRWAVLYDEAKKANDTLSRLVACDSLRSEYEVFKDATDVFVSKADSVIGIQHEMLKIKDSIIIRQDQRIKSDSVTIKNIGAAYYDEAGKVQKLTKSIKRKTVWTPVKAGLALVAGVLVGFTVK